MKYTCLTQVYMAVCRDWCANLSTVLQLQSLVVTVVMAVII